MESRNSALLLKGKVFDVERFDVRIGAKGWHTFEVIRHPGGVAVLPLHGDGTVTLISQLRPAVGRQLIELPAGRLDPGEDPAACGRRELLEETGLAAMELHALGTIFPSPGVFDEAIHLFAATGLSQHPPLPEADEEIATIRIPYEEALQMATDGRISDGKTIAALLRGAALTR
jgi:ADP-ribose pyrophosphatase